LGKVVALEKELRRRSGAKKGGKTRVSSLGRVKGGHSNLTSDRGGKGGGRGWVDCFFSGAFVKKEGEKKKNVLHVGPSGKWTI